MSDKTGIEWTEATWNPVTGCTKVSAGCANCYAERWAKRTFKGRPFSEVRCHAERLNQPLHWRKPRRIFVCSMGDLFHEMVPETFIDSVYCVMSLAENHIFQILTKRPKRMRKIVTRLISAGEVLDIGVKSPPANLWLGVSVENQETADERIPILLQTPATVRFVSIEPILGPVEMCDALAVHQVNVIGVPHWTENNGEVSKIDWVIVGGESGPKARPVHPDWVRSVRDQCRAASVPFFFKQWGEHVHGAVGWQGPHVHVGIDGRRWTDEREMRRAFNCSPAGYSVATMCRIGRNRAGRLLDGRTWDEMPKVNSAWGSSEK